MKNINYEDADANTISFEHDFTVEHSQTVFSFPEGRFAVQNDQVVTVGNLHTIKRGTSLVLDEVNEVSGLTAPCGVKIPPTGREEKVSQRGNETKCFGVVMVCNYCVYNEAGVFTGTKAEICGVCIGLPF